MKKISTGALSALIATALLAAPAQAANVTVRVEGTTQTLVPRAPTTATTTPAGKDGKNCSGTSALGAPARTGGVYVWDVRSVTDGAG